MEDIEEHRLVVGDDGTRERGSTLTAIERIAIKYKETLVNDFTNFCIKQEEFVGAGNKTRRVTKISGPPRKTSMAILRQRYTVAEIDYAHQAVFGKKYVATPATQSAAVQELNAVIKTSLAVQGETATSSGYMDMQTPQEPEVTASTPPEEPEPRPVDVAVPDSWEDLSISDYDDVTEHLLSNAYMTLSHYQKGMLTVDQVAEEVESVKERVNRAAQGLLHLHPEAIEQITMLTARTMTILGNIALCTKRPGMANYDDWDKVAEITENPCPDIQKQLLDGCDVTFPFRSEKAKYTEQSSHPICNGSRIVASTLAYVKAAKHARAHLAYHPSEKVVLFDIGAGSFGVKRLMMLKAHYKNKGVYIHASVPKVDEEDARRLAKLHTDEDAMVLNYVPATRTVRVGMMNYCDHKACDCDCMKYYDKTYAVSVHSSYYFTPRDIAQIHKHTRYFRSVMHIPFKNETIPVSAQPEYIWKSGLKEGSFWQRAAAKIDQILTGRETVVMQPLRTGETAYRHHDNGMNVADGGYHDGPALQGLVEHYGDLSGQLRTLGAAFASAALPSLVITPGPLPVKVCGALMSGTVATLTTAVAARYVFESSRNVEAPFWANSTVTQHVTNTYCVAETDEEIVHTVEIRRVTPPLNLVRKVVRSVQVDMPSVNRAAAALLTAGDTAKSWQKMAANLLRDKLPVNKVKGSMQQAKNLLTYLGSPVEALSDLSYFTRTHVAAVCLPLASGVNHWAVSTLYALSSAKGKDANALSLFSTAWLCRAALAASSLCVIAWTVWVLLRAAWASC